MSIKQLLDSKYVHWLKRTTIAIPEAIAGQIPDHDTIRIGYDTLQGQIHLYLVPRNGSGIPKLITSLDQGTNSSSELTQRCRQIAGDSDLLTDLIRDNIEGIQKSTSEVQYQPPPALNTYALKNAGNLRSMITSWRGNGCPLWTGTGETNIDGSEIPGCVPLSMICYMHRGTKAHPEIREARDCQVLSYIMELLL